MDRYLLTHAIFSSSRTTGFTTAPVALLLLMGGMVMIYFVLLGGANDASPLNRIYFLQAATKGIPNAPDTSRWTFWSVCRLGSNGHSICPNHRPGVPLDPPGHWNFNTKDNIPHQFLGLVSLLSHTSTHTQSSGKLANTSFTFSQGLAITGTCPASSSPSS